VPRVAKSTASGRRQGDGADETRAAIEPAAVRHFAPDVGEAGLVGCARVARREDPGAAIHRVDLEARVVGHDEQAGCVGVVAGLEQRVRLERRAGLLGRLDVGHPLEGADLEWDALQQSADLAQLAGVGGRHQQDGPLFRARHGQASGRGEGSESGAGVGIGVAASVVPAGRGGPVAPEISAISTAATARPANPNCSTRPHSSRPA
jgi:hypothetical protein